MLDPIAFTIFGINIYWYGITYVIGFIFTYFFVLRFSGEFGFKKNFIEDVFFYLMIFSVLGGRIFYILFYNLSYYLENPIKVFFINEGGMSIHGGILFGFSTLYYFSKKYKFNLFKLTDLFVIPACFGLAVGRLANFVNQELVGIITTSKIGLIFPKIDNELRYPYQLFAGFKNLLVFNILFYLSSFKKLKTGLLTAWFFILYSFGRFILDFIRVPTTDLGLISLGQLLSLIYGLFGIYLLYRINRN